VPYENSPCPALCQWPHLHCPHDQLTHALTQNSCFTHLLLTPRWLVPYVDSTCPAALQCSSHSPHTTKPCSLTPPPLRPVLTRSSLAPRSVLTPRWLVPYEDGTCPALKVRSTVLKLLAQLPIDASQEGMQDELATSGVGKSVAFYSKKTDEPGGAGGFVGCGGVEGRQGQHLVCPWTACSKEIWWWMWSVSRAIPGCWYACVWSMFLSSLLLAAGLILHTDSLYVPQSKNWRHVQAVCMPGEADSWLFDVVVAGSLQGPRSCCCHTKQGCKAQCGTSKCCGGGVDGSRAVVCCAGLHGCAYALWPFIFCFPLAAAGPAWFTDSLWMLWFCNPQHVQAVCMPGEAGSCWRAGEVGSSDSC
jgi:hypothetical protein